MSVICVDNVSFAYKSGEKSTEAVRNASLAVDEGEFFALLGHNGSGKSTLALLINGFLKPDSGKITVAGIDTADASRKFELRSTVGIVFQNPDNQTVASIIEDDIAFGCENLGLERNEIRRRVDLALETVGMSEYRERTPFRLSGGQKQRIAIAAILAMTPKILILDESTSMLDPQGRAEVMETVRKLNREMKMTVVHITHHMDEATLADRVGIMSRGEIAFAGTPREAFAQTELLERAKLEMPFAARVALALRATGRDVGVALTDAELTEGICRLP